VGLMCCVGSGFLKPVHPVRLCSVCMCFPGGACAPNFARFAPWGEPLGLITKPAPCPPPSPFGKFLNHSLVPPPHQHQETHQTLTIYKVPLSFLGFTPRPHLGDLAPLDPLACSCCMLMLPQKQLLSGAAPPPRTSQPASCPQPPHLQGPPKLLPAPPTPSTVVQQSSWSLPPPSYQKNVFRSLLTPPSDEQGVRVKKTLPCRGLASRNHCAFKLVTWLLIAACTNR